MTTDRGTQFTSTMWDTLCSQLGMEHLLTTTFHPPANGMVEPRRDKGGSLCQGSKGFVAQPPAIGALRFSESLLIFRASSQGRFVYIRRGLRVPPLVPLYIGPYEVLHMSAKSSTIRIGDHEEVVTLPQTMHWSWSTFSCQPHHLRAAACVHPASQKHADSGGQ